MDTDEIQRMTLTAAADQLSAQCGGIAENVALYYRRLIRGGVPRRLASALTMEAAFRLWGGCVCDGD